VSGHDYEAEAQTIADASREPHALIDSVKLEAAFIAADQRGYQRGLRDAREAVLRARVEQVGNGTLAAIDALIAKETP
jgi:hypothetical protein